MKPCSSDKKRTPAPRQGSAGDSFVEMNGPRSRATVRGEVSERDAIASLPRIPVPRSYFEALSWIFSPARSVSLPKPFIVLQPEVANAQSNPKARAKRVDFWSECMIRDVGSGLTYRTR